MYILFIYLFIYFQHDHVERLYFYPKIQCDTNFRDVKFNRQTQQYLAMSDQACEILNNNLVLKHSIVLNRAINPLTSNRLHTI